MMNDTMIFSFHHKDISAGVGFICTYSLHK